MQHFRRIVYVPDPPSGAAVHANAAVDAAVAPLVTLTTGADDGTPEVTAIAVIGDDVVRIRNLLVRLDMIAEDAVPLEDTHRLRLEPVIQAAAARGITVRPVVRRGRPVVEIAREAECWDADLILAPATGPDRLGLEPRDRHLVQAGPCSVWLARQGFGSVRTILCAVDPQIGDAARMGLAATALGVAQDLAHQTGARLAVLHCWEPGDDEKSKTAELLDLSGDTVARLSDMLEREAADSFAALVATAGAAGVDADLMLRRGPAADTIVDVADEIAADLLIIGTIAQARLPGLPIGETAEKVLERIECSVLALKPKGLHGAAPAAGAPTLRVVP